MQREHLNMPRPFFSTHRRQKGISLFVVIVFVMLSMLLAIWASRTSLFNEMIIGNDADYQRAFEAAQSLQQDAEFDIRGVRSDGSDCQTSSTSPDRVCRVGGSIMKFPLEAQEAVRLLSDLGTKTMFCQNGLCLKRTGDQDFWTDETTLAAMAVDGVGARYGQYTGAATGANSNPLLITTSTTSSKQGGWYWIEVMPYMDEAGNTNLIANATSNNLDLNLKPRVVYRITALAYGRKANTMVVLQQTYVRQKEKN